jgi:hypothetical protein
MANRRPEETMGSNNKNEEVKYKTIRLLKGQTCDACFHYIKGKYLCKWPSTQDTDVEKVPKEFTCDKFYSEHDFINTLQTLKT